MMRFESLLATVVSSMLLGTLFVAATASAGARRNEPAYATLGDLAIEAPAGWSLVQRAEHEGTRFVVFQSADGTFTMYARPQSPPPMRAVFAVGATVVGETEEAVGPLRWQFLQTTARPKDKPSVSVAVTSFRTEYRGTTYEGYARAKDRATADAIARRILGDVMVSLLGRSLTDEGFTGKKYYFGWGAAASGDPAMMHNEVKYDVLHTHDVFTKRVGGSYEGTTLIAQQATGASIRNQLARFRSLVMPEDMYVQYSSGHGLKTGIALGLSYVEMRDAVLAMPARELIVFIMACHSGGLVNAFNQRRQDWERFPQQGRTLFVLASSTVDQTSSTGPGTDPAQPGPNGSAGSAFGHALWKALSGQADGFLDGVVDGFLSLEEIRDFSVWRTHQIGGHTPVHTGAYAGPLVMNATPSKAFLASLEGGTEHMSDAQIIEAVQRLDAELRVHSASEPTTGLPAPR